MNRKLLLMAVAVTVTTAVHAQYVTYNHDSPKQNQVTVMETGTGALSPDLYYSVLHNKYKKSAAAKNKLSFRTLAGINLYNQVDDAEAIDSALVKRAKVEALNVAARQADRGGEPVRPGRHRQRQRAVRARLDRVDGILEIDWFKRSADRQKNGRKNDDKNHSFFSYTDTSQICFPDMRTY